MFRLMPPQRHDADPARSQVLAHIVENTGWDMGRAIRAFNSMRNKKSMVLTYDMVHRQWRGCDWVPPEDGDKVALLTRTINELKREIAYLKTTVRRHEKEIGQLERKRSSKRGERVEEQEESPVPEAEQQPIPVEEKAAAVEDKEEWFRAMRAALDEEDQKEKAEEEAASVPRPSSSLGSSDPTESRWENDEDEVS